MEPFENVSLRSHSVVYLKTITNDFTIAKGLYELKKSKQSTKITYRTIEALVFRQLSHTENSSTHNYIASVGPYSISYVSRYIKYEIRGRDPTQGLWF